MVFYRDWDENCEISGVQFDPLENQTKDLLEKYSKLLLQKFESKLPK